MADCLFCRIARKEILSEIIYEDDRVLAFLDIEPLAPGHALVVPKIHVYGLLELPDGEVEPLFLGVKLVMKKIQQALKPDAFTVGINNGRVSGQAVDHLHVHVIPRFAGDGGGSLHALVHNPPQESLSEIKDKLWKLEARD